MMTIQFKIGRFKKGSGQFNSDPKNNFVGIDRASGGYPYATNFYDAYKCDINFPFVNERYPKMFQDIEVVVCEVTIPSNVSRL